MPKPGFLTPSSFDKLMAGYKPENPYKFGQAALAVVNRLAVELLGFRDDDLGGQDQGGATGWGLANEWLAIETYQERMLRDVRPAEFTVSWSLPYVGGTMDGLVGKDGGVEVKCPHNPVYHLNRSHQWKTYQYQVHGYMWIFDLKWIDFISFDPRFPEHRQLIVETVRRDESIIEALAARCRAAYALASKSAQSGFITIN